MALSKNIVDLHQGSLTVTSRPNPDNQRGETCFSLALLNGKDHYAAEQLRKSEMPTIRDLDLERLNEVTLEGESSKKRNYTILLIEDNDELRAFEKEMFRERYDVLEAANGRDGLDIANEHLPDLILCDVMMPELNGLQVCKKIKSDLRTSHIPVILLTAKTAISQVIEGLEAGADDYLTKPFDLSILTLKVNNLVSAREELKRYYNRSISLDAKVEPIQDLDAEFINRLRNLMVENISNPNFGVNEIALQIGVSVSVLYRKLRVLTGMTVNDLMKKIRMQKALQLLESGQYYVNEVAVEVGFEDARYFGKEFKKFHGKSPGDLKSNNNSERNF